MTTVGYGNQAPVTRQGRALVSGLGWVSIILFGGISALAGNVLAIILDDFFTKYHLRFMTNPIYGATLWAVAAVGWLNIQAFIGFDWWQDKDPEQEFTSFDALWWSYISSTTVGLGDYFLAPETIFVVDVFNWSLVFLCGFVTLTSFLGKVADIFVDVSPNATKNLKERLARTNPFTRQFVTFNKQNKAALHDLNELVKMMDGSMDGSVRVETILRKKQLLIRLLDLTESELARFSEDGSILPQQRRDLAKGTKSSVFSTGWRKR
jgi:hypothetical protein